MTLLLCNAAAMEQGKTPSEGIFQGKTLLRLSTHLKMVKLCLIFLLMLSLQHHTSAKLIVENKCKYRVWPALVSNGNATLSTSGFMLRTGESYTVFPPATWEGKIWGRTLCSTNSATKNFSCVTGDCGSGKVECSKKDKSPLAATTVMINVSNSVDGRDFYEVSLQSGFNVPIMVAPVGIPGISCGSTGCPKDLNAVCPAELTVEEKGQAVACMNACDVFGSKAHFFCCIGELNPDTCEPNAYAQVFKSLCPKAYNGPYRDTTVSNCSSADYSIIFCPKKDKPIGSRNGNKHSAFIAGMVLVAVVISFLLEL